MDLLAEWTIQHGHAERRIELLHGDLTRLPAKHTVDLLVVSAFQNDYFPSSNSLIGALSHAGISVDNLAQDKQIDLREQYSCWLSKPVGGAFNFAHILCIESGWRGPIPGIVDDLFRAISPYLLTDFSNGTVAMPLIGAGDQNGSNSEILRTILVNAANWMQRGLPLKVLKIVVYSKTIAASMKEVFTLCKNEYKSHATIAQKVTAHSLATSPTYDVFLSYSHADSDLAQHVSEKLTKLSGSKCRIFQDKTNLHEGMTWLMKIADALDMSRRVVALYSANYWRSKNCQMEFLAALTRQIDSGKDVLFPVYLSDALIPYMFRTIQYADCRVNDRTKLEIVCSKLAFEFSS